MVRWMIAALVLAAAAPAVPLLAEEPAAPPAAPKEAGPEEIAGLIAKLGADDWKTREDATEALVRIGAPAAPALEKAAKSEDPEVKARALAALERIRIPADRKPPEAGREGPPKRRPEPFPGMAPWNREMAERIRKLLEGMEDDDWGPLFPGGGLDPDQLRKELERRLQGLGNPPDAEDGGGAFKRRGADAEGNVVEVARDKDGKVSVAIRKKKEDGTFEETRSEAASLKEFQEKYPELFRQHKRLFRAPQVWVAGGADLDEWRRRMEEEFRKGLDDPDFEKLRKEVEERFRRFRNGDPAGEAGIVSRIVIRNGDESVEISRWADGRIALVVRRRGEDGNEVADRYEAGSEEEFQRKFPEVYEKHLKGALGKNGIRIQFGAPVPLRVPRGLGVKPGEVTEIMRVHLGIEEGAGFVVEEVQPGSAAEKADLRKWDLVLKAGGNTVTTPSEVWKAVEENGSTELEVIRRGERVTLTIRK